MNLRYKLSTLTPHLTIDQVNGCEIIVNNYVKYLLSKFNKNKKFLNMEAITYHRKPTKGETKFGEGAIHYKDFETCFCWNDKTDSPKRWVVCPYDGLRYYYNP